MVRIERSPLPLVCLVAIAAACGAAGNAPISAGQDAGPGTSAPTASPSPGAPPVPTGAPGAADASAPPPTIPPVSNDAGSPSPPAPADGGPSPPPPPASDGGAPTIPSPTGTCPTFAAGDVTFSPAGIAPRTVTLSMTDAAKTLHGPLVFYWHGTGSAPVEATYAFGATLAAIEAAGGIVAAPAHDPNAGQFQWYLVNSTKDDDLRVADEVLACAAKSVGIDASHIVSVGFSAGALHTTAMSYLRSTYLSSVVTFSGGLAPGLSLNWANPSNKIGALIFDGGMNDNAFGFDFQGASQRFDTTLKGAGHFAAICNHGMGHAIPTAAAPSVWAFFQANPFGASPSPYASGLPSSFPTYCTL